MAKAMTLHESISTPLLSASVDYVKLTFFRELMRGRKLVSASDVH